MPKNKTDNFLNAIKKYAKVQKNAMKSEVRQLKNERLKEAEEKAKRDSEKLKKKKYAEKRAKSTALIASETQKSQKQLFVERAKMTEEVFELTAQRLVEYTETEAYAVKLTQSAKAIAELFEGRDCVLYLNERDMGRAEEIKALFGGIAEVLADKTIKIGGVKGYCKSMGIIADETLDSKLDAQREWFTENAALSVL